MTLLLMFCAIAVALIFRSLFKKSKFSRDRIQWKQEWNQNNW